MSLHLILGPMKSGKSLELIATISPFQYTKKKLEVIQPLKNVRDKKLRSRIGVSIDAQKVKSLRLLDVDADVIGIDEIHMFHEDDADKINQWISSGKEVYASGLDLDYSARLIPIIKRLYELQPETIVYKKSVCDTCGTFNARFSSIIFEGKAIKEGLPSVVPDDGTYLYQASCRECFLES